MEGLRELSRDTFGKTQKFNPPDPGYRFDALHITGQADGTSNISNITLYEHQIGDFFQPVRQGKLPELKLFRLNREMDVSLNISRERFDEFFSHMSAHPCTLYFISRDYDGFHQFSGDGHADTFFLGVPTYSLLWTFDPETVLTRVVFIRRRRNPYPELRDILRVYKNYIYTQHLMSFVTCVQMIRFFDQQTNENELAVIRNIESHTGYGPDPKLTSLKRFDVDTLANWSRQVNEIQGNLANKLRHQGTSDHILTMFSQLNARHHIKNSAHDGRQNKYQESMQVLAAAVVPIQRQSLAYKQYITYLKERAERLSSVVFALLTHEDSEININLAAISTELAAASKKDSSSMKTVAVMTMAFLPATFIAALFAVPSLQWDKSVVVQENFWVYWAITIPATVVIFLLWGAITGRKWIRRTVFSKQP